MEKSKDNYKEVELGAKEKDKKFKDSKSYICMKNRIGAEGKRKLKAEDFI